MTALQLPNTILLSCGVFHHLFKNARSPYLDRYKQLHAYNFIVGPHIINNNHWLAVIIDLTKFRFILLDPLKLVSPKLEETFNSWLIYYKSRTDCKADKWNDKSLDESSRPIQTDGYNCSIFVINFIKSYCLQDTLEFPYSEFDLMSDRQAFADTIKEYACNVKQ